MGASVSINNKDIAVIGMAFRFPGGVKNEKDFWSLLDRGQCAITKIPSSRWPTDLYQDDNRQMPGKSVSYNAGIIDNINEFDASFFGISPKEAEWMDPQQRFLLKVTYECLENANIRLEDFRGSECGVYTGISSLDYLGRAFTDLPSISAYTMTGNTLSIASNRISYVFDLHGPSVSMDTACSSSLVTLHHACQAVRNGEVPFALVASAHLLQHSYSYMGFSKASMLSATGTCRPFDERANGYVRSEGVAVMLIKPLEDAIRDHNHIHAVIKATGVNTDGSRKKGLTIPSETAQTELMREVLAKSGLSVNDFDFIEAHGTGTPVGDPIEVRSIASVYTDGRKEILPITSVKGNLGHMEPMSGLAGFVKTVLSLRHEKVPPVPFDFQPSSKIDFAGYHVQCYKDGFNLHHAKVHTAGINSFGFGGANAHVIVQTADSYTSADADATVPVSDIGRNEPNVNGEVPPLFLSAKTKKSLKGMCNAYADALTADALSQEKNEADTSAYYNFAYTAAYARDEYEHRLAVTGRDVNAVIENLRSYADDSLNPGVVYSDIKNSSTKVGFVFNGNGSQYAGMGRTLYAESRLFAGLFDRLSDKIEAYLHYSLKNLVSGEPKDNEKDLIQDTKIAQTLIFVIQVCLAEMLKSEGVTPRAVAGHSMGEIAASYVAGLLSLDEAVKVICVRSMLQDRTRGMGKMAAVSVSEESFNAVKQELGITDVDVAAVNSADSITVSGNTDSLQKLKKYFSGKNTFFKVLNVDYPFHSAFMNMIEKDVLEQLAGVGVTRSSDSDKADSTAYYSAVMGTKIADGSALNGEYWWHNIREKVQFCQAVTAMINDGCDYILEIGSNAILQRYLRDISKKAGADCRVAATLLSNNDNLARVQQVILECHLSQKHSDKSSFFPLAGKFIDLPHYSWDEQYFITRDTSEKVPEQRRVAPLLGWPIASLDNTWQNLLEPAKNGLLRDHVVDGECVYAAADFIETALEGASLYSKGESISLEHLDILSSLVFDKDNYKNIRFRIIDSTLAFDIKSRDYLADDEWVHNAKGRLLTVDDALIRGQDNFFAERVNNAGDKVVSGGISTVSRDEIYKITESLGLVYGEQFALVDHIDICGDSLKIHLNKQALKAHDENYVIHPGILDAGFHALFAMKQFSDTRSAYLPVKFGRISLYRDADVAYLTARILRTGSRSILASFQLYNSADRCVGLMHNCRFNMMPKMDRDEKTDVISSWYYDTIAAPHALDSELSDNMSAQKISDALAAAEKTHPDLNSRKKWFEKILPLMEQSVLLYGISAVKDLMISDLDDDVQPKKLENGETAVPKSVLEGAYNANPLYRYIRKLLEDRQLIRTTDDGMVVFPNPDESGTGDEAVQYAYHLCPEALPDLLPVYRTGNALVRNLEEFTSNSDIVNNARNADSMIYAGVRTAAADLISLVKSELAKKNGTASDRRLRVLTLGSGNLRLNDILTGSFADNEYIEVVAGDADSSMENIQGDNIRKAGLNSDTLEVELDLTDPAVPASFDLVFVEEALYKSANHLQAAENLKSLLAPSGILVVMERYPDWSANFCHGLDENWWQFNNNDEEVSPLKSPKYWLSALGGCFADTSVYQESAAEGYQGGIYLVVARNKAMSEGVVDNKVSLVSETAGYVLLTDSEEFRNNSFFSNLEKRLSADGNKCASYTVDGFIAALNENASAFDNYHNYVFAGSSGLAGAGVVSSEVDVSTSLDSLTIIANALNHLANPKKSGLKLTLSVVTVNGASVDYARFNSGVSLIPQQSAILGLARVIKSECEFIRLRSIDLNGLFKNCEGMPDALVKDIQHPDVLDEVILTEDGRYRVVIVSHRQYADNHATVSKPSCDTGSTDGNSAENYYLDFTSPGRLRNLCWKPKHIEALKDNEIAVDVKVTGLNFRDIMLTMGLVPDDALENGFSGPALGLEFAGVVAEVGGSVTEYKPGDRVLGFGSACFSNKLVVPDYAVAPVPDDWSLDSAATAPIVFFTAWYAIKYLSRMEKGESILIHGAAGGVGIAAIQIAKYLGLEVYATAGSAEKRDFLRMMGVEHTYNSRSLDFCDEIMKDTGGTGVDAVLNCLSGEAMRCSLTVLKPFGRFMELGKRDFVENSSIGIRCLKENISYFAIDVDQLFKFYPQRAKTLFHEVIGLFASGDFTPLPFTRYSTAEVVKAFRFMQQGGQIGKVTVNHDARVAVLSENKTACTVENKVTVPSEVFSADDTWLITGGTGGFGFATAKYLIEQGVKKLVLVSRSGIRDEVVAAEVKKFIDVDGLQITVEKCDVADYQSVTDLWQRLNEKQIRVTGIIHAAAVFADTMLSSMTEELYARVLNPKFKGALNLHKVSLNDNIKYFAVYSSISVAIGNIGQANYVAANSGLEGLTAMRLRMGLPAACIEWGPISDIGYLSSRTQVKKSLESVLGSEALGSHEALSMLPMALSRGGVNIFANLNWAGVADTTGRMPMRVFELVKLDKNQSHDLGADDLIQLLDGRSREDAITLISDMLVGEIADTMGLGTDQISKDQNLQSIGLDSLMAMELIVSIEKKTGVKLSVMTFQDNPTVLKLAEKIYMKFSGSDEEGGAELSAEQAALKKAILTHIDESDQEYLDMIGKKH